MIEFMRYSHCTFYCQVIVQSTSNINKTRAAPFHQVQFFFRNVFFLFTQSVVFGHLHRAVFSKKKETADTHKVWHQPGVIFQYIPKVFTVRILCLARFFHAYCSNRAQSVKFWTLAPHSGYVTAQIISTTKHVGLVFCCHLMIILLFVYFYPQVFLCAVF